MIQTRLPGTKVGQGWDLHFLLKCFHTLRLSHCD